MIVLALLAVAVVSAALYLQGITGNDAVKGVFCAFAAMAVLLAMWVCRLTSLLRHL